MALSPINMTLLVPDRRVDWCNDHHVCSQKLTATPDYLHFPYFATKSVRPMAKQQLKPTSKEAQKPKAKVKSPSEGFPFLKFLIAREQWADWGLIGGLSIAILIFLKVYYPDPQTETDSGNYILSAITGKSMAIVHTVIQAFWVSSKTSHLIFAL
jgi:hypothetical protein